jgi:hypothetical protein
MQLQIKAIIRAEIFEQGNICESYRLGCPESKIYEI